MDGPPSARVRVGVKAVVLAATDLRYSATATVIDGAIAALEIRGFS
jgi:hypothetical protein